MKDKGFTLIEVVFAVMVGLILLTAIYTAILTGQRSSVAIEAKTIAQQDVRAALELMAMEIRMASYNPTFAPDGMWRDTACVASGIPGNKGIQEATRFFISIQMDIDKSGAIEATNEIIRYAYDSVNQRITRQVDCGDVQSLLGDTATGMPKVVRVINDINIPIFRYFNSLGNPTTSIPDISRIDITLAVETEGIDPSTGQRRSMIYSTSVTPRNHVIGP